jgi:hypothetical protein
MKVYAGSNIPVAPHIPNSIHFVYTGTNTVNIYINGEKGEIVTDVLTPDIATVNVTRVIEDALMPGGNNNGTTPLGTLLGHSNSLDFVATIADRDALNLEASGFVYVEDASGDPLISNGSSLYVYNSVTGEYTSTGSGGAPSGNIMWGNIIDPPADKSAITLAADLAVNNQLPMSIPDW